ncbi:hypothetical protein ACQE3E_16120 [Methylomonas sp. MED-D]|uniref:hypothetical protein n=1 Tax=unclassified Methylomonas TaxID=2608980 RepID=UPI0028A323D8|nr:hypothetical protein [Methylomonas sp. MV1]MDT4331116.1 hypothetical protein [Methylomonas sp. MV1]
MPTGVRGGNKMYQMYRGGCAGKFDLDGIKAGYLISKLMREWQQEDDQASVASSLPSESLVNVGKIIYKKPVLLESYADMSIINLSMKSLAAADEFARKQHSQSSSKTDLTNPPCGNSAYVGMTDNLKIAKAFASNPEGWVWRFDIPGDKIWKGGTEDEWLALGGTKIYNLFLSKDSGITFTPF